MDGTIFLADELPLDFKVFEPRLRTSRTRVVEPHVIRPLGCTGCRRTVSNWLAAGVPRERRLADRRIKELCATLEDLDGQCPVEELGFVAHGLAQPVSGLFDVLQVPLESPLDREPRPARRDRFFLVGLLVADDDPLLVHVETPLVFRGRY